MTLRLKDREQQAWLDKMTGGLFSEALNLFMEDAAKIEFQINDKTVVTITRNDLEIIDKYHPDFWNAYPEVTPPEGVLMRVECENNMHTALIWKDGAWQYESGEPFAAFAVLFKVKRFRPWE